MIKIVSGGRAYLAEKWDYAPGLKPGNCHPNGRAKMREEGKLP